MATTDVGTGATLAWTGATNLNAHELLSVTFRGLERGNVNTSHMGTTGWHTFMPTDLTDPGYVDAEFHFDDSTSTPEFTSVDTAVLTIKTPNNTSTGWTAAAMLESWEADIPFEDKMVARATFKLSGSLTS